jgi:hypothetical protein
MQMLRTFWDAAVAVDPEADRLDEKRMQLCRAAELSALWREGGLESVEEQPINISMRFESLADYWDPFLLGQGPAGSYARQLDHDDLRPCAMRSNTAFGRRRKTFLSCFPHGCGLCEARSQISGKLSRVRIQLDGLLLRFPCVGRQPLRN